MAYQQIIYIILLTTIGAHGITLTPAVWIQGEAVSLTCTGSISVSIKLDGNEITQCLTGNNDRCDPPLPYFTTTVDGSTNIVTFTIHNVSRTRDEGTWSCGDDGSVVIDVKVKPSVHILSTPVNRGEEITLTCVVKEANPPVSDTGFTWKIDDSVITNATTSTYTINQDQPSDSTAYVCTGNNGVGIGISPSVNINIPNECRITFAIEILINVFLPSAIIVIIVIIVITVIYFKSKEKWWLWLIKLIINVLCDCCLWYLVYVVTDPEPECQDISEWILQITVVIITPRGIIYLIYLKMKAKPGGTGRLQLPKPDVESGNVAPKQEAATGKNNTTDYAICLILLLFIAVPSVVTLVILIRMYQKRNDKKEKTKDDKKEKMKEDVESGPPPPGGTGPRQLPKLPKIGAAT